MEAKSTTRGEENIKGEAEHTNNKDGYSTWKNKERKEVIENSYLLNFLSKVSNGGKIR